MLSEEDTRKMLDEVNKREFKIRNRNMIERFIIDNEDKKLHRNDYRVGIEGKRVLRNFVPNNTKDYFWYRINPVPKKDLDMILKEFEGVGDNTGD